MTMATKKKALAFVLSVSCLAGCVAPNKPMESNSSNQLAEVDDSSLPLDQRNLSPFEYGRMNLVGIDELGRKITKKDKTNADKKYIGLFYSLWHGAHETGIYDVTKLESTEEGKTALLSTADDNPSSPMGQFHYWGEPLFGYYHSGDPYVLKKHLELFLDAGIDYLCFDATNDVIYEEATNNLLNLWLEYQNKGYRVPKLFFYTNSNSAHTAQSIYDAFYSSGKYDSLWMSLDGVRPLLIGITENNNNASDQTKYGVKGANPISDTLQQYFDVRESEWPNGDYNANSMPWMSWQFPQAIHTETKAVSIPVAQHSHSSIYVSSGDPECSRGYDNVSKEVGDIRLGANFQSMWDSAFSRKEDIDYFLCTGWNEWMAIKGTFTRNGVTRSGFVDVYDEEFSRDLEMERGKLGDNYYLQLLGNSRSLELSDAVRYAKKQRHIDVTDFSASQWDGIPVYGEMQGKGGARDYKNCVVGGSDKYTDDSSRNVVSQIQVTQDAESLYFRIECADSITDYNGTDSNYMNLFLGTKDGDPSFMGFNYVVNRDGRGLIEKSKDGSSWENVGTAILQKKGNVMQVCLERKTLGLLDSTDLSFKVADHVTHPDDPLDYYVSGDSAPIGRLGYAY